MTIVEWGSRRPSTTKPTYVRQNDASSSIPRASERQKFRISTEVEAVVIEQIAEFSVDGGAECRVVNEIDRVVVRIDADRYDQVEVRQGRYYWRSPLFNVEAFASSAGEDVRNEIERAPVKNDVWRASAVERERLPQLDNEVFNGRWMGELIPLLNEDLVGFLHCDIAWQLCCQRIHQR